VGGVLSVVSDGFGITPQEDKMRLSDEKIDRMGQDNILQWETVDGVFVPTVFRDSEKQNLIDDLREAREVIKQVGDAVQSPSRGMYHSFHGMVEAVRNIIKESNHGNKREK
jgi:hypothetical protein